MTLVALAVAKFALLSISFVLIFSFQEIETSINLWQCIKGSSTLRVAPKGDKPSPRIVFRYWKQDNQIQEFLRYQRFIKRIEKRAFTAKHK